MSVPAVGSVQTSCRISTLFFDVDSGHWMQTGLASGWPRCLQCRRPINPTAQNERCFACRPICLVEPGPVRYNLKQVLWKLGKIQSRANEIGWRKALKERRTKITIEGECHNDRIPVE